MTYLDRLATITAEYEQQARAYAEVAHDAAVAEADHKAQRAKAILRYRAQDGVRSHAEAETRAEADDRIASLYQTRLIAAAAADAHREDLRRLREQVASTRTEVASERAADQFHARGYTGAA